MKRTLLTTAVIVAASISLAACGPSRQERLAADNSNCESMGLKFGTPEFAQCRLMQDQRRDAADAAARANAVQALQNFNNTVQNNRVEYPPPPVFAPIGPQRVDVYTHRGF
jgi:hypothetical protein